MLAAWRRWSGSAKFLSLWFAASVAGFVFVILAHFLGIEVFPASTGPAAPQFSRSECLERKMRELYGDNVFVEDLSTSAHSAIASACAQEEFSGP